MSAKDEHRPDTVVTHAGRDPQSQGGAINPPISRASTILFPNVEELQAYTKHRVRYGRHGTPGTHAFEDAMCALEGADTTVLAPSGLAAITGSLLAFLGAGDHALVVDTIYEPTRSFCDTTLKRLGIETTYFDPAIGGDIGRLMTDRTRVVMTEAPGSRTFEMMDVPAVAAAAHERRPEAVVMIDNTWATPLHFKPLAHGVDVSIQAATKYIVGHADVMLGTASANGATGEALRKGFRSLGLCASPDDVYLAQRGLRTLSVRLARHAETATTLVAWFLAQPEVSRILYPPHPTDPGHALWARDFTGACGLFGVIFRTGTNASVNAFLDALRLFGLGYSWGGYESLAVPNRGFARTATVWAPEGPSIRVHAGLEDPSDLIADLERAMAAYRATL